jgi:outer membrane protein OmpA-like peptidoglycan-associated protein
MEPTNPSLRLLPAALMPIVLACCQALPKIPGFSKNDEPSVVYALGGREGFRSPLEAALKPACPALEFPGNTFSLGGGHQKILKGLADEWQKGRPRHLIAGYTPPGLPEDYARSLSERRAQAVRQFLIEAGVEAASLQTVGFGFDSSPSSPTSGVVVIYRQ